MKIRTTVLAAASTFLLFAAPTLADSHMKSVSSEVDVSLSGWARFEYGIGDERYGEGNGDDTFGVSKAALETHASYGDFELTTVLGTTIMSTEDDDDLEFKEIYMDWNGLGGSSVDMTIGIQPLMFGLKPNGYPGDRTIQPSLEYGGAGGMAISNQDGAILAFDVPVGPLGLELAVFDTDASTNDGALVGGDGSSLWDNWMAQLRYDGGDDNGFYASAGIEGLYSGDTDDTETLWAAGVGYTCEFADLSAEYIGISEELAGTADDETYVVVELTVNAMDDTRIIVDWATADEADVDTLRAGVHYDINDHVVAMLEWSNDDFDTGEDVSSVDGRLTFMF